MQCKAVKKFKTASLKLEQKAYFNILHRMNRDWSYTLLVTLITLSATIGYTAQQILHYLYTKLKFSSLLQLLKVA